MKPIDTRISPGSRVKLTKWDADDRDIIGKKKSDARTRMDEYRVELETLQELRYAEGKQQVADRASSDGCHRQGFNHQPCLSGGAIRSG